MRSIESDGDTIDQAIQNALRALQVERDRVEIEIVADATRGIFGFGGKKARVRATVRAPLSTRLEESDGAADVPRETVPTPPVDRVARPAQPRPSRPAPPRERPTAPPIRTAARAAPVPAQVEARYRPLVEELLQLIGVSCQVRLVPGVEDGEVVLEVTGDSGGLLIGRRGQTLDALEYIVNRMVGRDDDGATARIVLDVEGYRERRREYLESLAQRLAAKARQTGRVVTLNPMSPRDRRIVHLALHEDQSVTTRSQGEGFYRRMVILPAGQAERRTRPAGPAR